MMKESWKIHALQSVCLSPCFGLPVTLFRSDTGWTNNWVWSGRTLVPRAARLHLEWRSESATETTRLEVFIPAGNLVPGGKPVK